MHGGDGTGSEANSAAWPSGQGDWRIGVSLSPFWPSTIKRQDGFAVNDALLFSTHSIGLNAAMRNRSSQALHIQANTSQHYWTLHPGGNTRLIMDVIGAVVLFFDLWIVPFVLSWNLKDKWVNDLAAVSILYWLIDLLLNFFTGYHRYGEVEMGLLKSMKHYLLTMFTPDAVVLVADMVATMAEIRESRLLRAAKVGKLFRMLRVARLLHFVERLNETTSYALPVEIQAFFRILELLLCIVWVNHLLCCAWWAIGQDAPSDTGMHWVDAQLDFGTDQGTYTNAPRFYQYTTSLHWSMVQMTPGSMQVQPLNSWERAFNVVCLIFGIIFFSSLISSLSSVTTHMRLMKSEQVTRMKTLRKFMNQRKIDRRTQLTVLKQVSQRLRVARPLVQDDVEALRYLSDTLRRELHLEMILPHVMSHGFLRLVLVVNPNTAMSMCSEAMDFRVWSEADTLFLPDSVARSVLFLTQGLLVYKQHPDTARVEQETLVDVTKGEALAEAALWVQWTHVGQCDASSMCEVVEVSETQLSLVVRRHHALHHIAWAYCQTFHARVIASCPPHAPWPTDLHVPFTSFREIVMATSAEVRMAIGRLSIDMLCSKSVWLRRAGKKKIQRLTREVNEGTSTLVPHVKDPKRRADSFVTPHVERLVALTALEVIEEDGRMLVELARYSNHKTLEVRCQAPSVKQLVGESPSAALERLLQERLSVIAGHLSIQGNRQDEVAKEGRQMMCTTYMRTVYNAKLDTPFSQLATLADMRRISIDDTFVLADGATHVLFAWLPTATIQRLQSPSSSAELKALVERSLENAEHLAVTLEL